MLELVKLSGDFRSELLKFLKVSIDFSRQVLTFAKFSSQKTRCFGHGRRIMFLLRNVFEGVVQTHVNYNGKQLFAISGKKRNAKKQLIASELNSFGKVRMIICTRGDVFSREVLEFVKLSGGFR